jgi:hypothetical protein
VRCRPEASYGQAMMRLAVPIRSTKLVFGEGLSLCDFPHGESETAAPWKAWMAADRMCRRDSEARAEGPVEVNGQIEGEMLCISLIISRKARGCRSDHRRAHRR